MRARAVIFSLFLVFDPSHVQSVGPHRIKTNKGPYYRERSIPPTKTLFICCNQSYYNRGRKLSFNCFDRYVAASRLCQI